MTTFKCFKCYDYNVIEENSKGNPYKDNKKFIIQAFGINSSNKTASIFIENFYPFFYIMVNEDWDEQRKNEFMGHLKKIVGNYYEDSIMQCKLVKRHKLYGFDNKKLHNFIKISFTNTGAYNKLKKIFYDDKTSKAGQFERTLKEEGYKYSDDNGTTYCYLYEADIPPLLKFFHEKQISPSGWIKIPSNKVRTINNKTTNCCYEYSVNYEDIYDYKEKETLVKYNICSFDIEASSSHGDFPIPIKNYKKLATNILENYNSCSNEFKDSYGFNNLKQEILSAFDLTQDKLSYIQKVYPKKTNITLDELEILINKLENYSPSKFNSTLNSDEILKYSESESESEPDEEQEQESETEGGPSNDDAIGIRQSYSKRKPKIKVYKKDCTLIELIKDNSCEYTTKLVKLTEAFANINFPALEGDIITFIGLSFINYTEEKPYKRIIIVKGGCKIPDKYLLWAQENSVIVLERSSEKEVLLTFTKIINSENPHIITGYNITGFDFEFI